MARQADTGMQRHDEPPMDTAQGLVTQAGPYAAQAAASPRAEHATVAGSQAISRDRLLSAPGVLREAADRLDTAHRGALRLPHPAPEALELAALATDLRTRADTTAQ